jgi:uncharacterized DUF497 family protein
MRRIILPDIRTFEWDSGNETKNKLKHDVEKYECEEIFDNKPFVAFEDPFHSMDEQRYQILGITDSGRKLTLAITIRKNKFRVIMARDQSKKERLFFAEQRKRI